MDIVFGIFFFILIVEISNIIIFKKWIKFSNLIVLLVWLLYFYDFDNFENLIVFFLGGGGLGCELLVC